MPSPLFSLFIRLHFRCRQGLPGGRVLIFVALTAGCADLRPDPAVAARSAPSTVHIGVAETDQQTGESGLQQVWRFYATEGLTARGSDGRVRPRIAASWEASDDRLTWRIELRPNVLFHDGTRFDAAAAQLALQTALKRPGITGLYPGLLDVVGIRTEGDSSILIDLRQPSAFLLDDLDIPLTRPLDTNTGGTGP